MDLGSILVLVFINDSQFCSNSDLLILVFADDTALSCTDVDRVRLDLIMSTTIKHNNEFFSVNGKMF